MQSSVYKDRQFEIDALRSTKPVKTGKSVADVTTAWVCAILQSTTAFYVKPKVRIMYYVNASSLSFIVSLKLTADSTGA